MNFLQDIVFTDEATEFTQFQAATPTIDISDVPLYSNLIPQVQSNPTYYLASAPGGVVSGIDFNLANNFWGVNMNYGTDPNGIQIRQGIAHLVDRGLFAQDEISIAGHAKPADNPTGLNLPTPNPCGWDTLFPESGNQCTVGPGSGGLAYHLSSATGVNFPWQPALGSPDFCAAAQHLVRAGVASGMDQHTCVLKGLSSGVGSNHVKLFIRSDNEALDELGYSISQEICALFTGSFSDPCSNPGISSLAGSISSFTGFTGSPSQTNLSWWMYTSGAGSQESLDGFSDMVGHFSSIDWLGGPTITPSTMASDLMGTYFNYASAWQSGGNSVHPQCVSARTSYTPSNYGNVCDPAYDTVANAVVSAPCTSASGDPTPGQTVPSFGYCSGTSQLSMVSAGYQAENILGQNVYALPVFVSSNQYAYLSNWSRVIDSSHSGIFNSLTWLNAYSANPPTPGILRVGFSQQLTSLNPYIAHTPWDLATVGSVYDSLYSSDPNDGGLINWLATSTTAQSNNALGYTPPPGTVLTYRYNLRNDVYFQDGSQLTAWDVKFSYASLDASGSYFSPLLQPMVCSDPISCVDGVTVRGNYQVDIHVAQAGIAALPLISSIPILPGRYWTLPTDPSTGKPCSAKAWDNYVGQGSVPNGCMTVDPTKATVFYDPIQNGIFIGSGPWMCRRASGSPVGSGCSSTGTQVVNGGNSLSLTRFGVDSPPAGSGSYFRSSGTLALFLWTSASGYERFVDYQVIAACFGAPVGQGGCTRWQQGIGNPGGDGIHCCAVGTTQVTIAGRFYSVPWLAPYDWIQNPPSQIGPIPPILYEGTSALFPASQDQSGCSVSYNNGGGYDC